MIAIIDYGLGNVGAFHSCFNRLGIPADIVSSPSGLSEDQKFILPGVGSFDHAMQRLRVSGFAEALNFFVNIRKVPVLGVCVGMQIMAERSDEGKENGLGWVPADVVRLPVSKQNTPLPIPHMGWNSVNPAINNPLFIGLSSPRFYFLHSYCFVPRIDTLSTGITNYGGAFVSSFSHENIHGVQFHPEKSHGCGVKLLENFARKLSDA